MRPGKPDRTIARRLLATAIAACFAPLAFALPVAPGVVNGNATFVQSGNALTVTNSSGAIINWNSFSIGGNESVRFVQTSSTSSVLNRVLGSDPSLLLGSLQSNGRVFLINPAGILVGQGARIDVAGFVASTLNLSDSDFLANRLRFTETPGAGKVQNSGEITTPSGGYVYLVAPQVENHGIINAPNGEVLLAAGQRVELIDTATPGVKVEIVGSEGSATNLGTIAAEAGRIGMVGVLVRNSGTLNTSSLVSEGGRIFLKATQTTELAAGSLTRADGTQGGTIQVDSGDTTLLGGTVAATGSKAGGGYITLLGDKVGILDGARLDASGEAGGGTILAGGDYQGRNTDIRNASITYLAAGATINADARTNGQGGKVILWADDTTRAYGSISARGGAQSGDGGFVEVSGKQSLAFDAAVNTSAASGKTGTLLLDPNSVTIYDGPATAIGGPAWTESGGGSTLQWSSIDAQLQSTNVTITTTDSGGVGDDIVFSAAYGPMTASATAINTLALNANDKVVFNQSVDLKGGLSVVAGSDIDVNAKVKSFGNMNLAAGNDINIGYSGLAGESGLEMAKAGGSQTITAANALNLTGTYNPGSATYIKSLGTQTISADSITLTAGTSFASNRATIDSNGAQSISTTTGNLLLNGSTDAQAEISGNTTQSISIAGDLTLIGGAGASAGGAFIGAPVQNISVGGDLTLIGGSGATLDAYGMAAPAAIGNESGANVTLNVGGSVSLSGTSAINPAIIGAATGTASVYLRGTDINLGAYSFIGNWGGSTTGTATLVATSGAIQQLLPTSGIRSGALTATSVGNITLDGANRVDVVDLTTTGGDVSYHTANPNTTRIGVDATGDITVIGDAGSTSIQLVELRTVGASAVVVAAQGQILEGDWAGSSDVGVADIVTASGNVTLSSVAGTPVAGTLAISADVESSGTVSASVVGGPLTRGSIGIRDVGASAASVVNIDASAATLEGDVDYFRFGDLDLGSGTALTLIPMAGATTSAGASGDVIVSAGLTLSGASSALHAGGDLTLSSGTLIMTGDGLLAAGGNLSLTGGNVSMGGSTNAVFAGGALSIASGKTITAGAGTLDVVAGSLAISGTLSGFGDTLVISAGNIDITGGGSLLSSNGKLSFLADGMNVTSGSVNGSLGIDGTLFGGLTLGALAGGTGTMNAANGVVDLMIGGAGIEMFNGSYLNSTDATQPYGGLIEIFFAGVSAGGSLIDGVATFDGGYKVGGSLTTLGFGLNVTYGILSNPVSDALVGAINDTADSAGGTSQTSDSLSLLDSATAGGSTGTSGIDTTQTSGGDEGSFGGEPAPADGSESTTGNDQDGKNAKKKPAQCRA